MSVLVFSLFVLSVDHTCSALSEHYYRNDHFLGYQSDKGYTIQTFSDLTLVHCSAFCIYTADTCKSFFYDADDQRCSLLKIIPSDPSGLRQPTSNSVLYSPIKPIQVVTVTQSTTALISIKTPEQPTVTTTTTIEITTSAEHSRNVSECLTFQSDFHVQMRNQDMYLVLIGPTTVSIDVADTTCRCLGGNLISLDTNEKFDYFSRYLEIYMTDYGKVAIGLSAEDVAGEWMWPSGTYLDENITPFCKYEPNGDHSQIYKQRCTLLEHPFGCMDDRNCPNDISHIYFACDFF